MLTATRSVSTRAVACVPAGLALASMSARPVPSRARSGGTPGKRASAVGPATIRAAPIPSQLQRPEPCTGTPATRAVSRSTSSAAVDSAMAVCRASTSTQGRETRRDWRLPDQRRGRTLDGSETDVDPVRIAPHSGAGKVDDSCAGYERPRAVTAQLNVDGPSRPLGQRGEIGPGARLQAQAAIGIELGARAEARRGPARVDIGNNLPGVRARDRLHTSDAETRQRPRERNVRAVHPDLTLPRSRAGKIATDLAVEGEPAPHVERAAAQAGHGADLRVGQMESDERIVRGARGHGQRARQGAAEQPSRAGRRRVSA